MSDKPQGPGWWQASDNGWYPPEAHADAEYRQRFALAGVGADRVEDQAGYPARLAVNRDDTIARWRFFLQLIMLTPHLVLLYVLNIVGAVATIISWFAIMFTGKMPESLHTFIAMTLRYANRLFGFALFMTEEYPPFEFASASQDPTSYPIRSDFDYDPGARNRLTVFFRLFMVIPHLIVLTALTFVAYVMAFIGAFAVLFLGKLPGGFADFLIGVGRWATRTNAYARLLTDEYPPFSLS